MKKEFKKQVASVALSMAIAGSSAVAASAPVYASEEESNLMQTEQSVDEDVKEEAKEVVEETNNKPAEKANKEVSESSNEEATQENTNGVNETPTEETIEANTNEVSETIKEETAQEGANEVNETPTEEIMEEVSSEVSNEIASETVNENSALSSNNEQQSKAKYTTNSNEVHRVAVITSKVDENGNPLVGAILQIIDANGNVVDEWVSDGTEHISLVPEGDYTLHEKSAPEGYKAAADKTFTIKVEVNELDAGVDYSETPCSHYGGTPLYYVESGGEKQEAYCINQDWETPDDNSVYDGKIIKPTDINVYTRQTVYTDAHQNKERIDISDQSLTSQELYDKVLDIVYHRQQAANVFADLTEAEIRYVTEAALKNYINAGLTRVQRVAISQAPTGYENTDYYITDDGKYMWYLYPWYRSFVYDPDAPLGKDVFKTDIGNGDAFGTLARHWSTAHGGKNSEESRAILARYYELYQYLINSRERHPEDMHLYIFYTDNKTSDLSGYNFDGGAYQNLLGIRWFDPYDEEYKTYLSVINTKEPIPEKPNKPEKHEKVEKPKAPTKSNGPETGDNSFDLALALAGLGGSAVALTRMAKTRKRENK